MISIALPSTAMWRSSLGLLARVIPGRAAGRLHRLASTAAAVRRSKRRHFASDGADPVQHSREHPVASPGIKVVLYRRRGRTTRRFDRHWYPVLSMNSIALKTLLGLSRYALQPSDWRMPQLRPTAAVHQVPRGNCIQVVGNSVRGARQGRDSRSQLIGARPMRGQHRKRVDNPVPACFQSSDPAGLPLAFPHFPRGCRSPSVGPLLLRCRLRAACRRWRSAPWPRSVIRFGKPRAGVICTRLDDHDELAERGRGDHLVRLPLLPEPTGEDLQVLVAVHEPTSAA